MSKSKIRKQKKRNIKKNRKKLMMRNKTNTPSLKRGTRFMKYMNELNLKSMHKGSKEEWNMDELELIKTKEIPKLPICENKLYTPHYKTLPSEIVEKIENVMKKYPIRERQCFSNTSFIIKC